MRNDELYALLDRRLKDLANEHIRIINSQLFLAPFYGYPLFRHFYRETAVGRVWAETKRRVRHAWDALMGRYCECDE